MGKNYTVTFTGIRTVELRESELPTAGPDEILVKLEVSQISTGTELTYLEGNIEKGSTWEKDIVFPRIPGYSAVGRIVAVGANVSADLVGKRVCGALKHQLYQTVNILTKVLAQIFGEECPEGLAAHYDLL